jgi:hypothetical protein
MKINKASKMDTWTLRDQNLMKWEKKKGGGGEENLSRTKFNEVKKKKNGLNRRPNRGAKATCGSS